MPVSFQKNLKFSPKPETRLDEFDFIGGLVTDAHETKLKPNQSPNLQNVIFNDTGSIKTRNGYSRYNTTPIGAASDQANTGASAGTTEIDDSTDRAAQTFQPSGAISVTQVDLYLAMETTGQEQYLQVQLWSTSGGAPSALLTNGTGEIKLISGTSETAYNFRFREPVSLSAATTYAIVLQPYTQGSSTTVNDILAHRTGAAYGSGQIYTSTDSGINWSAAGNDLKFVVYGGGNTGGTGLLRFYGTGGIKQLIAKVGTSLYRGADDTGVMTAITLGSGVSLTTGNYLDYTIANDTLLVVDGTNKIQKYRGSTNANYTTGTITATNGSATVAGASTVWNTSTNAAVGEYIQLPDTKWYKITAIASDTSLTIERTYQGATLAGQTYKISPWGEVQGKLNSSTAPTGLVRPSPTFIENHSNRIWTLEGNTLRFSVLDTSVTEEHFNDWDTSNNAGTIIVPSGKGDTTTGLYSLNNVLYVFQRRAIWGIYGNSPANFELRNISNEIGMVHKRTLVEWNDILAFLSDKGVILFDGSNIKNITESVINNSIDDWANKTSVVAVLWGNRYMISHTESGGSYNSEALFYDFARGIWGKMTEVFAGTWNVWGGSTDVGEVYFISSNQGSIYRWDSGTNDNGYTINTVYDTPSLGFGANTNDKTIKRFYVQQLAKGDYNMTASMFADINTSTTTSDISLATGDESLWDTMVWGTDSWSAEGTLITTRVAEFQGIAKYYKFRFEQNGFNEGYEILGVTVTERVRRLA